MSRSFQNQIVSVWISKPSGGLSNECILVHVKIVTFSENATSQLVTRLVKLLVIHALILIFRETVLTIKWYLHLPYNDIAGQAVLSPIST